MEFYSTRLMSPFGDLTLFEHDGAITALEWGQGPKGESSDLLKEARAQLSAYFKRDLKEFDLPLDPMGTDFQKRVWNEMLKIDYGQTKTYGDVAKTLGSAARAVGGACGKNPIPIIIPCHRIVGHNQKLTGYSGGEGLLTKTRLLDLEQTFL